VRTNLLFGAAAVGVLITGAIAQTSSGIERIKDAAGHSKSLSTGGEAGKSASHTNQNGAPAQQTSQPKKTVRTVYPNTQNAEQAVRDSKTAHGKAEASKPGDVTPLSTAQQPANQANTASPAQTPQQNAQASSTQSAPVPGTQQSTPTPSTQTTQASTPAPAPSAQPTTAPQPTTPQPAPTATAQQSTTTPQPAQAAHQGSSGVIALDTQQQTSIGEAIARHNVKPLTNVTFSMAVGAKVPAAIQLRALPSDVATFVPQYRGYSYVVVEEQMVIVDPATQAIVAIVPYTAATVAARTAEPAPAPRAAEPAPATRTVEKSTAKSHEAAKTKRHPRPIAQKPMVTRSVNLNTEEKSETRQAAPDQRKTTTRNASKREVRAREPAQRDYRERAPRTVTIEQQDEPVYREPPRQRGFFGFFGNGGYDDED